MNKDIKKVIKKNQYRSRFYSEYKGKKKTEKKEDLDKSTNRYYRYLNKVLISLIVLLVLMISKNDRNLNFIYKVTFSNMNFAKIDAFFMSQFNSLFPKTTNQHQYVNDIVININTSEPFENGVMVETELFQSVQSHTDGIVVQIYKDNELGNVVVIQNSDGFEYLYGMLADIKVSLYSRVNYGEVIGIGKTDNDLTGVFYLAIIKNDSYQDVVGLVNNED